MNSSKITGNEAPVFNHAQKLTVLELFAGIGSYTEGLNRLGIKHEILGISEINKYAIKAHGLLHGEVPNLGDIRKIEKLPKADLVCYAAPCTDISLAGKMRGMDKDSKTASSLLWEVERLLLAAGADNELPKYLVMENVPMLVSKKFIHHFNDWLKFLESLGYKNYWQVLNAKDYGIPQTRKRVFLVSIFNPTDDYVFPKAFPLEKKLLDYLDSEVDEKYFVSETFLMYCTDPTDRNGYIREKRFKPHDANKSPYAFTITTRKGSTVSDNFVIVPENTIKGFNEAKLGDGIYINRPHQKRGCVQKGKIQTIKRTVGDLGVIVAKDEALMIRKITPRESLRLMGWEDHRIDLIANNFSDARLYEFAGNGIVINVLAEMFRNLFE
ncbi:MAG: DNA (cytosine-5-)-methyltransferase [Erysipelotrichales bacterium]|nr:DNA (cytosine-5-)-methyltransferase [Erysipelotrichales bacterium]